MKKLIVFLLYPIAVLAQQPQVALSPHETIQGVNAKWNQGVGTGYWPTCNAANCSTLVLKIEKGTCFDSGGTRHTYAGSTLTMAASNTNYITLAASSCTPQSNTTGYGSDIPIATIVTSGSAITGITDDRTFFGGATGSIPSQYKRIHCDPGMGDGVNAFTANTYPLYDCYNDTSVTWTVTNISCYTDNNGTSTLDVKNNAGTSLLTGVITCTNVKSTCGAAGTQSGTTTIPANDAFNFTFIADGSTKTTTWCVGGTQ